VYVNPAWRDLSLEGYRSHPFEPDASIPKSPFDKVVILSRVFRGEGSLHSGAKFDTHPDAVAWILRPTQTVGLRMTKELVSTE